MEPPKENNPNAAPATPATPKPNSTPTTPGTPNPQTTPVTSGTPKRPYQKPAFRHERVFETTALTCHRNPHGKKVGKLS